MKASQLSPHYDEECVKKVLHSHFILITYHVRCQSIFTGLGFKSAIIFSPFWWVFPPQGRLSQKRPNNLSFLFKYILKNEF